MNHYLVYWKFKTVERMLESADKRYCHAAGDQLKTVKKGDVLWIVTSEGAGDLALFCRIKVSRIVGQVAAEKYLKQSLWDSEYHVLDDDPDEVDCLLGLPNLAMKLRFDGSVDRLPESFTGQNLQRIRRLTDDSVERLEKLWKHRHDKK